MPKGPSGAIITIMRRLAIRAAFAAFAAACLGVSFAAAPALAQPAAQPGEEAPQPNETRAEKLDRLYGELQAATGKDAEKIVEQIQTVWAKSGSDSMDFLLMRAKKAIAEEAYAKARIHLAALTRLAPDFAEAWNASATLRFLTQDYAEAVVEIERTPALVREAIARATAPSPVYRPGTARAMADELEDVLYAFGRDADDR